MTTMKTAPFDAAEYLDSEEAIAAYLSAALEEDDPALFLAALADVAKARGMTQMAKDAGVGRESLYKAGRSQHFLPRDGKPSEVRGGERKNTLLPFAELSVSRFV